MSDLQTRLKVIEDKAQKIRAEENLCTPDDTATQAEMVAYLAAIVRKHLETDER